MAEVSFTADSRAGRSARAARLAGAPVDRGAWEFVENPHADAGLSRRGVLGGEFSWSLFFLGAGIGLFLVLLFIVDMEEIYALGGLDKASGDSWTDTYKPAWQSTQQLMERMKRLHETVMWNTEEGAGEEPSTVEAAAEAAAEASTQGTPA